MRTFLAIGLPDDAAAMIGRLQANLPLGRPVPDENLHLTLAFLDDRDDETLSGLHAELDVVHARRFPLELAGLECFGGDAPRVLALLARPNPALADLHRRIGRACRQAGIVLPHSRFRPHVTIARFAQTPEPAGMDRLRLFLSARGAFALPAFDVLWFSLYRSTLRQDGAVYDELARYPLG